MGRDGKKGIVAFFANVFYCAKTGEILQITTVSAK